LFGEGLSGVYTPEALQRKARGCASVPRGSRTPTRAHFPLPRRRAARYSDSTPARHPNEGVPLMKWFIPALVALSALSLAPLGGQEKQFDLTQQQSPPRPLPAGIKFIDQGQHDPRLKGYFTPDGVKMEIVADHPVVTNPVGMTFGPDGTLYVLEWLPATGANFPESFVVFTYKDGTKKKVAIMKKPVKDH